MFLMLSRFKGFRSREDGDPTWLLPQELLQLYRVFPEVGLDDLLRRYVATSGFVQKFIFQRNHSS
jgi:hypothetical protein